MGKAYELKHHFQTIGFSPHGAPLIDFIEETRGLQMVRALAYVLADTRLMHPSVLQALQGSDGASS